MLVYNTTTKRVEFLVELDGNGGQPIVVNLDYMQDTAPSDPQEKQIWYNTSDNKIYTYKNGAWDDGTEPSVGVFYKFGDNYYLWDGNSLEVTDLNIYEKIANKTDDYTETSSIKYPSSKALSEAIDSVKNTLTLFDGNTGTVIDTHANLGTVIIFKNGQQIYQGADRDYTINGSIITFTEPLVNTDVIGVINSNLVALQLSAVATSGDYNDLINKPVMSFSQVGITETSSTFVALANQIQSKGLQTGTILYGEVTNSISPMPFNGNGEVKVEILETKTSGQVAGKQVLMFTLYSADIEPYQWTFVYYQPNYETEHQTWTWSSGGGSQTIYETGGKQANINNNYGGLLSFDNKIVSLVPTRRSSDVSSRVYFSPNEPIYIGQLNSADSWEIGIKFKLNGLQDSNRGNFISIGKIPFESSPKINTALAFGMQLTDGLNGFCLFLSSNGSSWNINNGTVDTQVYAGVGHIYEANLQFTGSQYVLSIKKDDESSFTTVKTITSSNKIYSSDSDAQLVFGGQEFFASGAYYQTYSDYYLVDCYAKINGTEIWRGATDKAITQSNIDLKVYDYLNDTNNTISQNELSRILNEIQSRLLYLENK